MCTGSCTIRYEGHTYFTAVSCQVPQQVHISLHSVTGESPVIGHGESSMRCVQCRVSYLYNIIIPHLQDVETVVGDISRGVKQLKNLQYVILERCCDELIRGVVEGLWRRYNPQHQLSSPQGKLDVITLASTSLLYYVINKPWHFVVSRHLSHE